MQGIYYISVHKRQTLLFNKKNLGRSRKDCPRFFVYGVGPYPEKFYFSLQIYHICHKPFGKQQGTGVSSNEPRVRCNWWLSYICERGLLSRPVRTILIGREDYPRGLRDGTSSMIKVCFDADKGILCWRESGTLMPIKWCFVVRRFTTRI